MKGKHLALVAALIVLGLQWPVFRLAGIPLSPAWAALSSGLSIFAAAYVLSWGGELAQVDIPQSLAIAFLALVAVLPEYAVDLYFAWRAGKDPAYVHFATANMTGSNRLLIGVGWSAVVFASFVRRGRGGPRGEIRLGPHDRNEILALLLATLYAFVIPLKGTLSWIDFLVFLAIFAFYIRRAAGSVHEEPEIDGPMETFARWPSGRRRLVTVLFFAFSGVCILLSAKPFAESLLEAGRALGIEQFLLVQWLAPLASEAPEFILAILFALKARADAGLRTLLSSKVNQWTLLVGMVPIVYNLSARHGGAMPLDARQSEEILLTASQSFFALAVVSNLRFSVVEALLLLALFVSQLFISTTEARTIFAFLYITLGVGWFAVVPGSRKGLVRLFRPGSGRRS